MSAVYENRASDFFCRGDNNYRSKLQCSPHLHYHIEFVQLLEGKTVGVADTEETVMEGGDISIAFPNQLHRFETKQPEKYRLFIVNPDLMPEFRSIFTTQVPRSALIKGAGLDPEINALTKTLFTFTGHRHTGGDPYSDAVIRGCLLALFGKLLPMMSLSGPRTGDSRAVREVVGYCSEHFAEELSLEVLEDELHLSKYYISHLFSGKLGIRFNDYINSLRISHACRLLRREDMQITEVAEAVGFSTLRTFNRAFSKFRGMTPSEYRRDGATRADGASLLPIYYAKKDSK
ncbi:MAG: helix-turn-helix domain-containing protein [Eubacteriales bacterium]